MYTTEFVRLVDFCIVILAGFSAHWFHFGVLDISERYGWGMLLGSLLALLVLPHFNIYRSWRGQVRFRLVFQIVAGYLMLGGLLALVMFMTKTGDKFSRLWVGYWMISAGGYSILARAIAYPILNRLRAKGKNRKSVLLIGDVHTCERVTRQLSTVVTAGFDVGRVILTDQWSEWRYTDIAVESYEPGAQIAHAEQEVWICLPLVQGNLVREIQSELSLTTCNVRYMPDMSDFRLINHDVSDVAGLFMLDLSCSRMSLGAQLLKWVEDRLLSLLIVILLSPLLLLIALLVKCTSRGPVFYTQERVGLNGRPFKMLKFRSMPVNSEVGGVQWGNAKSKDTTCIGRFLRKSSLDELPQFLNVLRGDMSIVGPRPERTIFVQKLRHEIPGYMQKHMVKAGITGWAQINGWRGDTDLAKRIECDLWYVEHWSLWLDIRIIILTLFKGLINKHAY
ncbi:undecaprenyl-phosphate glucose phosphotransferase [Cobetia sp. QF-1]|uniref:Undecaprenyl-phosphate glucose phosphotransferase n=2 Tax=Cobetia crustatorum TaxID=553385 RepID=A0A558HNU3_9GAMM|nr:undecaprenyl-phosphate glucose phosphotransferase [Cobetia sp. QF-1]TVU70786.1 undecaprenyl-phosphate glucose phosphotransferase [Cobetia crustatorum]